MENNYHPVGTIVRLDGIEEDIMIVQRNIISDGKFESYGGLVYPNGYGEGNKLFFFDDTDINDIVFKGYSNEKDEKFIKKIEAAAVSNSYKSSLGISEDTKIGTPIYKEPVESRDFIEEANKRNKLLKLSAWAIFAIAVIRSCMR